MGNGMVLLFRAAVPLNGKPTYDSEGNQSHEEGNIRFVFQSQGYCRTFLAARRVAAQMIPGLFSASKLIGQRVGARVDNNVQFDFGKTKPSVQRKEKTTGGLLE